MSEKNNNKDDKNNNKEENKIVFQYVPDNFNKLYENKYCKSLIIAYYSITRSYEVLECEQIITKKNLWAELYQEIIKYYAGENIEIQDTHFEEKKQPEKAYLDLKILMDNTMKGSMIGSYSNSN